MTITIERPTPPAVVLPPVVKADYCVGAGTIEPVTNGVYEVSFSASSSGLQGSVNYYWKLDPGTSMERHLAGQLVDPEFGIDGPNGPYAYHHDAVVVASGGGKSARESLQVVLPSPRVIAEPDYAAAIVFHAGNRPKLKSSQPVPVSAIFQKDGLFVRFAFPYQFVPVRAICSGFLGQLSYVWDPAPKQLRSADVPTLVPTQEAGADASACAR